METAEQIDDVTDARPADPLDLPQHVPEAVLAFAVGSRNVIVEAVSSDTVHSRLLAAFQDPGLRDYFLAVEEARRAADRAEVNDSEPLPQAAAETRPTELAARIPLRSAAEVARYRALAARVEAALARNKPARH